MVRAEAAAAAKAVGQAAAKAAEGHVGDVESKGAAMVVAVAVAQFAGSAQHAHAHAEQTSTQLATQKHFAPRLIISAAARAQAVACTPMQKLPPNRKVAASICYARAAGTAAVYMVEAAAGRQEA